MRKRKEATVHTLARAGEDLLFTMSVPQPAEEKTEVLERKWFGEGPQLDLAGAEVLEKLEYPLAPPTTPHSILHVIPQSVTYREITFLSDEFSHLENQDCLLSQIKFQPGI